MTDKREAIAKLIANMSTTEFAADLARDIAEAIIDNGITDAAELDYLLLEMRDDALDENLLTTNAVICYWTGLPAWEPYEPFASTDPIAIMRRTLEDYAHEMLNLDPDAIAAILNG